MGKLEVVIRESVVSDISRIAWYIEFEGLIASAKKFSDDAYDFISDLGNDMLIHSLCREPQRNLLGQKCKVFRKKYTVVFFESEDQVIVSEFVPSKLIRW